MGFIQNKGSHIKLSSQTTHMCDLW